MIVNFETLEYYKSESVGLEATESLGEEDICLWMSNLRSASTIFHSVSSSSKDVLFSTSREISP